jgi:sulfatase maturation enzyme AslB (radical SAM superfamily)
MRNLYGYPYNDGYVERDLSLVDIKKIFEPDFVKQLTNILLCGNFGDALMNNETIQIIEYFQEHSPQIIFKMSTNGGARNKQFWQDLARLGVEVTFCIDGLEDTHSLYRKNTSYNTVTSNAKTFIEAGGSAVWQMIDFDYNEHQQEYAKTLSTELGFKNFKLINRGPNRRRNNGPVFDKNKKLIHVIGKPLSTNFEEVLKVRQDDTVLLEDIIPGKTPAPISCQSIQRKEIYVDSTGNIYPCCYLGFNPTEYGHGHYLAVANRQFRDFINKNNALKYPLADCIAWFSEVEKTWTIDTFEKGRLVICNDVCGKN